MSNFQGELWISTSCIYVVPFTFVFFLFWRNTSKRFPRSFLIGDFFFLQENTYSIAAFCSPEAGGGGGGTVWKKMQCVFFWTHKVMEFLFLRMIFVPFFIGWFLGESAVCWYKGLDFMGLITIFHHHLRDMFFFKYFFQPPFPSKSKLAFLQKSIWKSQNVVEDMTLNLEASIGKNQTKSLIMVGAPWDGGHAR